MCADNAKKPRAKFLPEVDPQNRAQGPYFSCGIPRGWVNNRNVGRIFALVPEKCADAENTFELNEEHHALYSRTDDFDETLRQTFFPATNWALCYYLAYSPDTQSVPTLNAYETPGANCTCFVRQVKVGEWKEFYIIPYSDRGANSIRVCLHGKGKATVAQMQEFVNELAATVTLDEPIAYPTCQFFDTACSELVPADEFCATVERVVMSSRVSGNIVFEAAAGFAQMHSRTPRNGSDEVRIRREILHKGMSACAELNERLADMFDLMTSAFAKQKELRAEGDPDVRKMTEALLTAQQAAFQNEDKFKGMVDYNEDAEAPGIVVPGERQSALFARMREAGICEAPVEGMPNAILVRGSNPERKLVLDDDSKTALVDGENVGLDEQEYTFLRQIIACTTFSNTNIFYDLPGIRALRLPLEEEHKVVASIKEKLGDTEDGNPIWIKDEECSHFNANIHQQAFTGRTPIYLDGRAEAVA